MTTGGPLANLDAMSAFDDEDRPKKKLVHEIGQDLTLLSVKELDERVALLREEITRLEADKTKKQAQRSAADTLNLDEIERRAIERALARFESNISQAAAALGLTRPALYRRMRKHGL